MDRRFKPTVDLNAITIKKMEKMLLFDDLDWRVADEVKLKVLGSSLKSVAAIKDKEVRDVITSALKIGGAFDIKIDVARVSQSVEVRRSDANVILERTVTPGLVHQLGIIGPKGIVKAYEDFYTAWGLDSEMYLNKPKLIDEPLTLYQEIQICGQGEVPPMALQDNHEEKAQGLVGFMEQPIYLKSKKDGLFVQNVDQVIMNAARKHLTLAEALKPKGIPGAQGQANDTGAAQAGTAPQQGGNDARATTSRDLPASEGANGTASTPEAVEEPINA